MITITKCIPLKVSIYKQKQLQEEGPYTNIYEVSSQQCESDPLVSIFEDLFLQLRAQNWLSQNSEQANYVKGPSLLSAPHLTYTSSATSSTKCGLKGYFQSAVHPLYYLAIL